MNLKNAYKIAVNLLMDEIILSKNFFATLFFSQMDKSLFPKQHAKPNQSFPFPL